MNSIKFNNYVDERLKLIKDVLIKKSKEYSTDNDKLENFHLGAQQSGKSREEVLDGYLLKHLVSYRKMLRELGDDIYPNEDLIREKFGDIIIYFIIQEIQFLDRIDSITKTKN